MTVSDKYKSILLSPRFHQTLVIMLIQALNHYGIIDSYIANAVSTLLGVSITIATVDKASTTLVPVVINQEPPVPVMPPAPPKPTVDKYINSI
jgi:hypothetical protein